MHLQNPAYFLRFLDILRSPEGEPLLEQLLESDDKLAALLPPPAPGAQPPLPSADQFGRRVGSTVLPERPKHVHTHRLCFAYRLDAGPLKM